MKWPVNQFVPTLLTILVIFSGCSLDDDQAFFITSRKAFFLLENTTEKTKTILGFSESGLRSDLQLEWGVSRDQLSDMSAKQQMFWLAIADQQQVIQIDPSSEGVTQSFDTGSLFPHFLSIGDQYLLLSDTINKQIGFLHLASGKMFLRETQGTPMQAVWKAGKFYIAIKDLGISIFNEVALARQGILPLEGEIVELQADQAQSVYVYTSDSLLESAIEVNADRWLYQERSINAVKKRWSTVRTPIFDKEWTSPVQLSSINNLMDPGMVYMQDFEVDFFESRVFGLRNDSLFSYFLPTSELSYEGEIEGRMIKAYFWLTEEEE